MIIVCKTCKGRGVVTDIKPEDFCLLGDDTISKFKCKECNGAGNKEERIIQIAANDDGVFGLTEGGSLVKKELRQISEFSHKHRWEIVIW